MKIKEAKQGFILNGASVPNDPSNSDFQRIQEWISNGGEYEKFDYLQDARETKISELNAFILAKKTDPFQKLLAPEILFSKQGLPYSGKPVRFKYYNGVLPHSNIKSTDIVNSVSLDYLQCMNNIFLRILTLSTTPEPIKEGALTNNVAEPLTVEQVEATINQRLNAFKANIAAIYKEELAKGISMYPCEILRDVVAEDGTKTIVETKGIVNIFPTVFNLKAHIEYREKIENRLQAIKLRQIAEALTPEEVEAITFE